MPFLTRGKARARQNRPPAPPTPPPTTTAPVVEAPPVVQEEEKVAYQEVSYRVPKEERLLDLPLEEEVFGEENIESEEGTYTAQPVGEPVSIGVVLKKKKRQH